MRFTATILGVRLTNYSRYIVCIAGLGGLLYGIDVGIIAAALLFLGKTISLTEQQTSIIVAAVLGGSMVSSLVAGVLADLFGRRKMMIASGLLFVLSVGLIVVSKGFLPLLAGRLLQGMSGGVIAVVVPLYLAECLGAEYRGRGTAIFQFTLTIGIVLAAVTGWYYTSHAEIAIAAAHGDAALVLAAENHAWRGMFLSVIYPGVVFFLGAFALSETPRWLYRRGRTHDALVALRRATSEAEAQLEVREMRGPATRSETARASGSLLQRKYVVPFALACVILACNQATGINSILAFLVIILKQAGMSASHATQGDVVVKVLNCVMTIVAVTLVDKMGRKFLLKVGTAGIIVALICGAALFRSFESKRVDVKNEMESQVRANALTAVPEMNIGLNGDAADHSSTALTVVYSYGSGDKVSTVRSNDPDHTLQIAPTGDETGHPLLIRRAFRSPVPSEKTGWLITACLCLFIASFAVGPGVVVWLALSELMPNRIRSTGMGIALLLNQGVSTLIAAVFLPVVGNYGFAAMFLFWAVCTVIYFITAAFLLPETKGRSLEEIERSFDSPRAVTPSS
jgi:MFS transporter, SP family, solute carrier family 2 (myo-inositol transporter), member 13